MQLPIYRDLTLNMPAHLLADTPDKEKQIILQRKMQSINKKRNKLFNDTQQKYVNNQKCENQQEMSSLISTTDNKSHNFVTVNNLNFYFTKIFYQQDKQKTDLECMKFEYRMLQTNQGHLE